MIFKDPKSRSEALIQNILGADNVLEPAQSREEEILYAILNNTSYDKEPRSRKEELLLCILNGTQTTMTPHSRNEAILIAKINGTAYTDAPCSRMEELLIQWLVTYEDVTVSGSTVSFSDAAEGLDFVSVVADIDAVQDTSGGDPSPNNICPISGWQSVDVTQCGKNLVSATEKEETSASVARWCYSDGFILRANTAYTLSADTNGTTVYFTKKSDNSTLKTGTTATYTPSEDIEVYFRAYLASGITSVNIQLELGSTATDYEAYTGTTHTIPLGSTIYGGKVDAVTGELTVTHGIVDLGTLNYSYSTSLGGFFTCPDLSSIKKGGSFNLICDTYATSSVAGVAEMSDKQLVGNAGNGYVFIKDSDYTDATTFKTAMSGHYICYELATPTTATVTPTTISALSGTNTLYADSGDISVTYKRVSA